MAEVRDITVFKCVSASGVKWCHVLLHVDFEAKTSPNLVPRVAMWCNVRPHLGHILYIHQSMRKASQDQETPSLFVVVPYIYSPEIVPIKTE